MLAALSEPSRYAGLGTLHATLPFDAGLPTTLDRLAGLPVLIVQGSADRIIPTELEARSWTYLHESSGAALTAHKTPGGHGMTRNDVDVLAHWIAGLPAGPSPHDQ
ncbi:hypothetical protein GCM10009593_26570 [Microlunatus antarcticus]